MRVGPRSYSLFRCGEGINWARELQFSHDNMLVGPVCNSFSRGTGGRASLPTCNFLMGKCKSDYVQIHFHAAGGGHGSTPTCNFLTRKLSADRVPNHFHVARLCLRAAPPATFARENANRILPKISCTWRWCACGQPNMSPACGKKQGGSGWISYSRGGGRLPALTSSNFLMVKYTSDDVRVHLSLCGS